MVMERKILTTMEKLIDKPKKITTMEQETTKQYLKRAFPLEIGEHKVKYCPVGINRYRINFYIDRTPDSFMKDLHIGRSCYVVLKEDGDSWSHEII